jgi:hypothetical protein
VVVQAGFEPETPYSPNVPRGARSFSRNSGESWPSENLFANYSAEKPRKTDDLRYMPVQRGAVLAGE